MNQKEWKTSGKFNGKYKWYNQTRKLQRSLCYESDPNANIIHHLRDTEEQRNYNDTHYEFWGFNEDGTFEYGKYVVFWTKEKHDSYHAQSEETRKKNSEGVKASKTKELRKHLSEMFSGENNPMYGKRGELAPCYGRRGELHPMYGKIGPNKGRKFDDEFRRKMSENAKLMMTPERRKLLSEQHKGVPLCEEAKKKMSEAKQFESNIWKLYKCKYNTLKFNEFKKILAAYIKSIGSRQKFNFELFIESLTE